MNKIRKDILPYLESIFSRHYIADALNENFFISWKSNYHFQDSWNLLMFCFLNN